MKTYSKKSLDFPMVLKRVANDLVISIPDLGLFKNIELPQNILIDNSSKSASEEKTKNSFEFSNTFKIKLLQEIEYIWNEVEHHRNHKTWQPKPSTFKQSLSTPEDDYSLPDFVKKLNQFMTISENTIRREISRGAIRCYQTEGGHRRIPTSEIGTYLNLIENKKASKKQVLDN